MTPQTHEALRERGLLPGVHLVDTGFLDAELLVDSKRDYGVELLGPTRKNLWWQARANEGFSADDFLVDFTRRKAVCPQGHESVEWKPRLDVRGNESIYIRFSRADCGCCPSRMRCTRSKGKYARRSIAVRPAPQRKALVQRRLEEDTAAYLELYAKRAGIEGTISQGVRAVGLRHSRYLGLAKTHLGHILSAVAMNLQRIGSWLDGVPRAQTRTQAFAKLMATAA